MKLLSLFLGLTLLSTTTTALTSDLTPLEKARLAARKRADRAAPKRTREVQPKVLPKRQSGSEFPFLNNVTAPFFVNGTGLPDVDFDVGESYAGLLPISTAADETRELFFWFFPTTGNVTDEITIWLNGGPGCSSLEGLFQENGPVTWQSGTFAPVPNEYTWRNLTNMVWVEQPVGTGFSQGTPDARSETDVAREFLGFFQNFMTTFGLQNKKVYVTGESYAGYYVPYIVDAMHNANNTEFFDVRGLLIYDPSLTSGSTQESATAFPFVQNWPGLFPFNDTMMATLASLHESCGYAAFLNESLVFPPKGPLPTAPVETRQCDLWDMVFDEVLNINPCFDIYEITTTCPVLWDVLGFPGSFEFTPPGATVYFDRPEVQDAIHAPHIDWSECSEGNVFVGRDQSIPSAQSVLPGVIDKNDRTIIGHGLLDFILIKNGTLVAIQNMTFGGEQGFTSPPSTPFIVPFDNQGQMGVFHTERGLTFVQVELSGHMVPQFQPQSAFRHLQFLLGRIPSL